MGPPTSTRSQDQSHRRTHALELAARKSLKQRHHRTLTPQINEARNLRSKLQWEGRVETPLTQNGLIESFNGSLRDELLNEEIFDTLDDARRKLALWRYDYNNVRPHSSLGNQTPAEARRALEQLEGSAHDALAQTEDEEYEIQTRKLSL